MCTPEMNEHQWRSHEQSRGIRPRNKIRVSFQSSLPQGVLPNPKSSQVSLVFATRSKPKLPRFLRPLDTGVLCRTCCPFFGGNSRQRRTSSLSVRLIYNQYISVAAAPLRLRIMARYFNNLLTIKIHLLRNRRASGARRFLTTSSRYNERRLR